MSHVRAGKIVVTDMECARRATKRFGKLRWMENQRSFSWYGRWVNDYNRDDAAYKLGIDVDQYGKCDHAIKMDGCSYEIGLVPRKDGTGWSVVWDFWGEGKKIDAYLGDAAEKWLTAYQEEVLNKHAQERYASSWETTDEDDTWKTMELEVEG